MAYRASFPYVKIGIDLQVVREYFHYRFGAHPLGRSVDPWDQSALLDGRIVEAVSTPDAQVTLSINTTIQRCCCPQRIRIFK